MVPQSKYIVDIQSHFKSLTCCYFSQKINVLDFQQIVIPIHMGYHWALIVRKQSTISLSGRMIISI